MTDIPSARQLQLEKEIAARDKQIADLSAELEKARKVNDVLGKAIKLVEKFSEHAPATPTTPPSSKKNTPSSRP